MLTSVTVEICTTCDLSWEKHLKMARAKTREDYDLFYVDEDTAEAYRKREAMIERLYRTDDYLNKDICIALLKLANQGPEGPPGVPGEAGPRGFAGRNGSCCEDGLA